MCLFIASYIVLSHIADIPHIVQAYNKVKAKTQKVDTDTLSK